MTTTEPDRDKSLQDYRKKLFEHKEVEARLKEMRDQLKDLTKQYDKSENDLKALQSVGQIVGEVLKQLTEEKFIVKATNGPRYVVGCRRQLDKTKLKAGTRVALDMTTLTIMRYLPREVDPLVYNMSHEDPGDVTYSAIGGLSEQIRELREVIELPLLNPELFMRVGITPPKGCLLYGPPGTGKTLLARAVASQLDANFLKVVSSAIVDKYIGESARLIREMFNYAKDHQPCIIFMDEIDAIGGRRFSEGTSADREIQRTLMELLNQMDGFDSLGQNYFKSHNKSKEYSGHSSKVHSVGWSCDGKRLASGSFDKSVCIYTLERDRLNKEITFKGHGGSVDQLCWHQSHPDLLSTASGDKSVRIWDTRVQKCVATISTKGENINITWAPNGDTIAVGNKEDLVTFIDARTHKIKTEEQYNFEVNEISWNNTSDLFFLTNGQGCIHILSYPDLELQHILNAHPGTCICIEFDPTGKYFATGSADALVSLWDVDELACKKVFTRMDWPVRTISFSHDGQLLASASEDLIIDIGFTETGDKIADISVDAATFTVAWHPSLYLLAYACDDKDTYDRKRDAGSLKVWGFQSD